MTVFVMPDPSFVMPDLIGHLLLWAGKRLPVGAGNDEESRPAMTVFVMPAPSFVMPDLIGHLALSGEFSRNVKYS